MQNFKRYLDQKLNGSQQTKVPVQELEKKLLAVTTEYTVMGRGLFMPDIGALDEIGKQLARQAGLVLRDLDISFPEKWDPYARQLMRMEPGSILKVRANYAIGINPRRDSTANHHPLILFLGGA